MTELTQHEQEKLNEGRALRESQTLIPLLDMKHAACVGRIVSDFRAGKTDFLSHAAELSTVWEMRENIKNKIKQANILEAKMLKE